MVNSASQALAEFKSQKMGGLLSGFSSTVDAPTIASTSLADTVSARMARSAPKRSSTAFMDQIRQSGQRLHNSSMSGIQAQRQAQQPRQGGSAQTGYRLPSGGKPQTGGPRGAYGLTVGAVNAYQRLSQAYRNTGFGNLGINSGGRTYAEQARLYDGYRRGLPGYNKAAPPGTSLHESGIAADFGGALYNRNMQAAMATRQHQWMRQNAAQFGWYWTGKNFGESWHWEYHPEWAGR